MWKLVFPTVLDRQRRCIDRGAIHVNGGHWGPNLRFANGKCGAELCRCYPEPGSS